VAEFSVSAEADRALLVAFLAHASVLQCRERVVRWRAVRAR
jgi:hypothetical protein